MKKLLFAVLFLGAMNTSTSSAQTFVSGKLKFNLIYQSLSVPKTVVATNGFEFRYVVFGGDRIQCEFVDGVLAQQKCAFSFSSREYDGRYYFVSRFKLTSEQLLQILVLNGEQGVRFAELVSAKPGVDLSNSYSSDKSWDGIMGEGTWEFDFNDDKLPENFKLEVTISDVKEMP